MTNRMRAGVVLLVIGQLPGLTACGDDKFVPPTGPGPGPAAPGQPLPPNNRTSVAGSVYDTAFRPLAGARIEVVDGPQAGLVTVADASGNFLLAGDLDGSTQFRASKEGHVAVTTTPAASCPLCNPQRYISFNLELTAASVTLAGNYSLTFTADSACTAIPSELRTRTYAAAITPMSHRPKTSFEATLANGTFLEHYRTIWIGVAGDYVAFWLGDAHGQPGVVEQVAPNAYLAIEGSASGSAEADGSTISMTLAGVIEYCEQGSDMGTDYACRSSIGPVPRCNSNNHRVLLTRR
jgi:hypothetical protein